LLKSKLNRELAYKSRLKDAQAIQGKVLNVAISFWFEQQQLPEVVPQKST
jgi:hypothetical protein